MHEGFVDAANHTLTATVVLGREIRMVLAVPQAESWTPGQVGFVIAVALTALAAGVVIGAAIR